MNTNNSSDQWQDTKIGELLRIKHGYGFKGEFFSNEGPFVLLTPGNFYDEGGLKLKGGKERYYTGPFPKEFILKSQDLLVVMTEQAEGLLGSAAFIPENNLYLHNQRLGLITGLKVEKIDIEFLYYLFNSWNVRTQIRASANGAKIRHTSPDRIYEVKVKIPLVKTQQKIAAILSAYDDLIENNTRRIKILEEMVQAIYREWFVNFRFPGHEGVRMVESELGLVPEGWEVRKLGEVCFLTMGQSPNSEFYNEIGEGLPFHQGVTNFGLRFPVDKFFCTITNRIAEPGDILFSVRAPVGRINLADKKIVIGRGLSAIRHKNGNQLFIYHQLKEIFQKEDMIGGGTIFKSVTKEDVNNINVLTPVSSFIKLFEENIEPISLQLDNLIKKNVNLRCTRDLLLPKLISGELDVSELDIRIPEAEA